MIAYIITKSLTNEPLTKNGKFSNHHYPKIFFRKSDAKQCINKRKLSYDARIQLIELKHISLHEYIVKNNRIYVPYGHDTISS